MAIKRQFCLPCVLELQKTHTLKRVGGRNQKITCWRACDRRCDMTIEELKKTFRAGTPVVFDGITYKRVSALINRHSGKGFVFQAELQDKNNNSVTITEPSRITTPGKGDGK